MYCTSKTQFRKFETNVPRKGIVWPRPNSYIHVSVSDLNIPLIGMPILLQENRWAERENSRSQTHECGNCNWGRAMPFLGIHKFKLLCSVYKKQRGSPWSSRGHECPTWRHEAPWRLSIVAPPGICQSFFSKIGKYTTKIRVYPKRILTISFERFLAIHCLYKPRWPTKNPCIRQKKIVNCWHKGELFFRFRTTTVFKRYERTTIAGKGKVFRIT